MCFDKNDPVKRGQLGGGERGRSYWGHMVQRVGWWAGERVVSGQSSGSVFLHLLQENKENMEGDKCSM